MVVWEAVVGIANFLMRQHEEDGGPAESHPSRAKGIRFTRRCSYCGREVAETLVAYSNGYAVCHTCHRSTATENYWGSSAW